MKNTFRGLQYDHPSEGFDNDEVYIERKNIIAEPKLKHQRTIRKVVSKVKLEDANEKEYDLEYWLQKTPQQRVYSVTAIIQAFKKKNDRMDKSFVSKHKRDSKPR